MQPLGQCQSSRNGPPLARTPAEPGVAAQATKTGLRLRNCTTLGCGLVPGQSKNAISRRATQTLPRRPPLRSPKPLPKPPPTPFHKQGSRSRTKGVRFSVIPLGPSQTVSQTWEGATRVHTAPRGQTTTIQTADCSCLIPKPRTAGGKSAQARSSPNTYAVAQEACVGIPSGVLGISTRPKR